MSLGYAVQIVDFGFQLEEVFREQSWTFADFVRAAMGCVLAFAIIDAGLQWARVALSEAVEPVRQKIAYLDAAARGDVVDRYRNNRIASYTGLSDSEVKRLAGTLTDGEYQSLRRWHLSSRQRRRFDRLRRDYNADRCTGEVVDRHGNTTIRTDGVSGNPGAREDYEARKRRRDDDLVEGRKRARDFIDRVDDLRDRPSRRCSLDDF